MENFLWGLLATALLGIAVAAWQKPDFFLDYINPWLSKTTTAVAVLIGVWQVSANYTRSAVVKVIPDLSTEVLVRIQSAGELPYSIWFGLIGFAFYHGIMAIIAWGLVKHARENKSG